MKKLNTKEIIQKLATIVISTKKPLTEKLMFKNRIFVLSAFNLYYGMFMFATLETISKCIFEGLYHKVISSVMGNIPIGLFSITIVSLFFACLTVFVVGLNYYVYNEGLEFIQIKEKGKKNVSQ